jgi:hypothetical protein
MVWSLVFPKSCFFCGAARRQVRFPHMGVDDIVAAGFAGKTISNAANAPTLAGRVKIDLNGGVRTDGRFVDRVYEYDPGTLIFNVDPPRFSPTASAACGSTFGSNKPHLIGPRRLPLRPWPSCRRFRC